MRRVTITRPDGTQQHFPPVEPRAVHADDRDARIADLEALVRDFASVSANGGWVQFDYDEYGKPEHECGYCAQPVTLTAEGAPVCDHAPTCPIARAKRMGLTTNH